MTSTVIPGKTLHYSKQAFVYIWGKQIKNLAVMSGQNVNDVTNWLYRDYLTRAQDEVYKSIHAFVDHFINKEKN